MSTKTVDEMASEWYAIGPHGYDNCGDHGCLIAPFKAGYTSRDTEVEELKTELNYLNNESSIRKNERERIFKLMEDPIFTYGSFTGLEDRIGYLKYMSEEKS